MKIIKLCWQHSVRMMLAAVAIFLSLHAHAVQGYAVLSADKKTLTFRYGNPTGTVNVNYFNTDNTNFTTGSNDKSRWGDNMSFPTTGYYGSDQYSAITKVVFESSFASARPKSCAYWFYKMNKLTTITGIQYLNTSQVTDMSYMFYNCSSLKSLDVTKFNTSQVTNMRAMFSICESLTSLNVSNFDTRNVTNMTEMFANCKSLTSLNVSNFNTSKVTSINIMFCNCQKLTSLDLRNFDMRQVTLAKWMIEGNSNLQKVVFGRYFDVGKLDVNNQWNGYPIIADCPSLRYVDFFLSDDTDAITSANVDVNIFANKAIPATAVVYLPHGSKAITNRQNFVYSYNGNQSDLRCPKYYSVDKVDIEFPRQFKTNEAVYDRTATMGSKKYGSVILPFAFTSNSDIQAFALTKQVKKNGKVTGLTFTNVSTVAQHTPFAFLRKGKAEFRMKDNSGNFGITVYPVRSTNKSEKTWTAAGGAPEATPGSPYIGSTGLSNWKTKGYYVKETVNDYNGMFFVQYNEFKRAIGPLNLVDHRVLFYPTDGSGAASVFSLSFEDEDDIATAIEAAETEHVLGEAAAIYDASGCRLAEPRKGLNIVRMSDGTVKKVFIK